MFVLTFNRTANPKEKKGWRGYKMTSREKDVVNNQAI